MQVVGCQRKGRVASKVSSSSGVVAIGTQLRSSFESFLTWYSDHYMIPHSTEPHGCWSWAAARAACICWRTYEASRHSIYLGSASLVSSKLSPKLHHPGPPTCFRTQALDHGHDLAVYVLGEVSSGRELTTRTKVFFSLPSSKIAWPKVRLKAKALSPVPKPSCSSGCLRV